MGFILPIVLCVGGGIRFAFFCGFERREEKWPEGWVGGNGGMFRFGNIMSVVCDSGAGI